MIQKYVEQLVEDLQKAIERAANPGQLKNGMGSSPQNFQDHISAVEQYLDGPTSKLSEIVGIDAAMFPPDDLLSDEQTGLLVPEMELLLNAFNFYPDFPQNKGEIVPSRLRYRALREKWDSEQTFVSFGEVHLEFCDYDEKSCPFPGYCSTCSEFEADDSPDAKSADSEAGFIPSIFNYCDRWCERCSFTARCESYAFEKEILKMPDALKKSPDEKIQDIETRIAGQVPPVGNENSDPYCFFDPEGSGDPDDLFSANNKSDRHPLALSTFQYSMRSHQWLKTVTKTCKTELTRWLASGNADQILNAIETVTWYHFFIYPKIRRALSGHFEMEEDEFAAEDMNGSANITLIALDRSIEAFTALDAHLTTHRIEMAGFVESLNDLRHSIELFFPDARNFIRPESAFYRL
jgi:hypothetical protein